MDRSNSFHIGASPDNHVAAAAARYMQSQGMSPAHNDFGHVAITRTASDHLARAYDNMPDFDRRAVPAFRQMAGETGRQFDFMTRSRSKGGMGLDVQVTKHDPYGANGVHDVIGELRHDVANNNRIQVLSTASTGGHPIFSNDENDMFRAVHDVFGHLGSGRGIDHHGEEAAFQKHSQMFSPLARRAMATETRGQNSALRASGSFQDQKVGFLPHVMQQAQFSTTGPAQERLAAAHEARAKNQAQGI